ncbi:translation initiation factor IF-2-like [Panthera pardus]|uniref:Translation initiation factor IF-2-like n=1 Tax=Panthera pardus TaxID=9691 RepID=A0A9W2V285_PANPR|nr:translation initiation factor IF-2-like [Panthera pardus]
MVNINFHYHAPRVWTKEPAGRRFSDFPPAGEMSALWGLGSKSTPSRGGRERRRGLPGGGGAAPGSGGTRLATGSGSPAPTPDRRRPRGQVLDLPPPPPPPPLRAGHPRGPLRSPIRGRPLARLPGGGTRPQPTAAHAGLVWRRIRPSAPCAAASGPSGDPYTLAAPGGPLRTQAPGLGPAKPRAWPRGAWPRGASRRPPAPPSAPRASYGGKPSPRGPGRRARPPQAAAAAPARPPASSPGAAPPRRRAPTQPRPPAGPLGRGLESSPLSPGVRCQCTERCRSRHNARSVPGFLPTDV